MKTLISISIALLFCQSTRSQENSARKDFLFENPVAKERIKIETGNKIALRFKIPNVIITGTILSLSDSSLTLGIGRPRRKKIVLFRNIANMAMILEGKKRYIARVMLKNSEKLHGELIRTTQDSISIRNTLNFQRTTKGVSEIKSIRIRRRRAIGKAIGICAGAGAFLGGFISYTQGCPLSTIFCHDLGNESDAGGGVLIGGVAGVLAGAAIGLALGKEFKIEGNQAQFDLFANEFMK